MSNFKGLYDALNTYYSKQKYFYLALYMLLIIGTLTASLSGGSGKFDNNIGDSIAEPKTSQTLSMSSQNTRNEFTHLVMGTIFLVV